MRLDIFRNVRLRVKRHAQPFLKCIFLLCNEREGVDIGITILINGIFETGKAMSDTLVKVQGLMLILKRVWRGALTDWFSSHSPSLVVTES